MVIKAGDEVEKNMKRDEDDEEHDVKEYEGRENMEENRK